MRNGNIYKYNNYSVIYNVLILPMRNGNNETLEKIGEVMMSVLILPMRNGNKESRDIYTLIVTAFLSYL